MLTNDIPQIPMNIDAQQYSWAELLYAIKNKKCVLVLGPYLSTALNKDGKEQALIELLAEELAASKPLAEKEIRNRRDLAFVAEEYHKEVKSQIKLQVKVEQFYNKYNAPNSLLEKIAQFPFHLIINTAPDNLILKAYEKKGILCDHDYYNFRNPSDKIPFNKESSQPFVYNLMGFAGTKNNFSAAESLVLTEKDRLKFMEHILQKEWKIPPAIAKELNSSNMFIFLGFRFEQWYLRMMIYTLKMKSLQDNVHVNNQENPEPSFTAEFEQLQENTKLFYYNQFNTFFIQENETAFLDTLWKQWQPAEPQVITESGENGTILCLHADKDKLWKNKFLPHLRQNLKNAQLAVWERDNLTAGEDIIRTVMQQIRSAKGIVLLLSIDFLIDEDMMDFFLPEIVQRHQHEGLKVQLIVCRACDWKQDSLTAFPTVLPRNYGSLEEACRAESEDKVLQENAKMIATLF